MTVRRRARRAVSIWWALLAAEYRSRAQYRANFAFTLLAAVLYNVSAFLVVWLLAVRFNSVGGWSLAEVAFVFGLRLAAHGLWLPLMGAIFEIEYLVRHGHFDRFLVRPVSPLVQVATFRINVGTVAECVAGIVLLSVAAAHVDVAWTAGAVAFLVLAVVGGALVEAGVQLFLAGLTLRVVSLNSLSFAVDNVFTAFGGYPISVFSRGSQYLLTFALPVAFVAFLPSAALLGRTGELAVPPALAFGAPLVGAALFYFALLVWRSQLRRYQSSGH